MSWLFSQALVAEYLAENCLDGEQFAPLSVMPTRHKFWRNDKTMEFSNLSQFGLMCKVLTEQDGEELLMSYLAAFHARTSAQLEKAQELKVNEAECGKKWRGLLAKYDPSTHSWKTAQCSLLEDLELSLQTWPRWGSMRNGECYQQPMLAQTIKGKESGYWATPTTMDKLPPKSEKALLREATIARPGRTKPANLRDQVSNMHKWPTPSATDGMRGGTMTENMTGQSLTQMVNFRKTWPTPVARMHKDCAAPSEYNRNEVPLAAQVGGQLNPTWTEWLMGWPLEWTDLKPLETDKCLYVQQRHFSCLEQGLSEVAA